MLRYLRKTTAVVALALSLGGHTAWATDAVPVPPPFLSAEERQCWILGALAEGSGRPATLGGLS